MYHCFSTNTTKAGGVAASGKDAVFLYPKHFQSDEHWRSITKNFA